MVISGSGCFQKSNRQEACITMNKRLKVKYFLFASKTFKYFPSKRMKEMIVIIDARVNIRMLRFISKVGMLGIKSVSLKYLMVQSNTTLLIEAARPRIV